MTVAELIKKLQQFPANSQVVHSGDTGYACTIGEVEETSYPYRFTGPNSSVEETSVVVELFFDEDASFSCYPCL